MRYYAGIDEAGRGPIAGPVAVGVVLVPANFDTRAVAAVRDSKQLPQGKRESWLEELKQRHRAHELQFAVAFATQKYIDRHGIRAALGWAVTRALREVQAPADDTHVRLDGALTAPQHYVRQETLAGGDRRDPLISFAAIAAKVRRDEKLVQASRRFPQYGFERHKGYGTRQHYAAIRQHGLCSFHRKTFIHDGTH